MKRAGLAAAFAACLLGSGVQAQTTLWLRPPAAAEVAWRGMLPTEGGAVGMGVQIGPYPAFGAAGLLVAIFTHAAISQGVQSVQRQREQEEANRVLDTYLPALRDWSAHALWDATVAAAAPTVLARMGDAADPGTPDAVAELVPVFTLSQDEGVLIADVAVKLVPTPGATAVESLVRVVSSPHEAADARAHWQAESAARLKATAARMLAHAVWLARQHGSGASGDAPTRTHRYLQGSVERAERAQLLAGDCARAVLRTLRGGLLSVPLRAPEGAPCPRNTTF